MLCIDTTALSLARHIDEKAPQMLTKLRIGNIYMRTVYSPCKQHVVDVLDVLRELLLCCRRLSVPVKVARAVCDELARGGIKSKIVSDNHVCIAQVVALDGMNATDLVRNRGIIGALTYPVVVRVIPAQVNGS